MGVEAASGVEVMALPLTGLAFKAAARVEVAMERTGTALDMPDPACAWQDGSSQLAAAVRIK